MAKNIRIPVRVTRSQYERAKNDAEAKGFSTLSGYVRSLMFTNDFSVERKIEEIHFQIIKGSGFDKRDHKLKERPLTEYLEI